MITAIKNFFEATVEILDDMFGFSFWKDVRREKKEWKEEEKDKFYNLHMVKDGVERVEKVDSFYLTWFVESGKDFEFDECYAEEIKEP